jgi:hypothetical protein
MRCGRTWLCPVCAAIVGQARAEELTNGLRRHLAEGGGVYLATMTLRHRRGPALAEVLDVLSRARGKLVRSYWWRERVKEVGLVGWVRAVEITVSERSGWPLHAHWLLLTERPVSSRVFADWWLDLSHQWADQVGSIDEQFRPETGLFGPGVDLRGVDEEDDPEHLVGYLVKDVVGGAGMEMARPDAKHGRGEWLTGFEVGELAAKGSRWGRAMWEQYQTATKGRHRMQWSKGLRKLLELDHERTEKEILEDVEAEELITELDDKETAMVLFAPDLTPLVCESAERGGAEEVHRVLRCVDAPIDRQVLTRACWGTLMVEGAGRSA